MKRKEADWYKTGWSLDIKGQSWTENTQREVSFLVEKLGLRGGERILDLACGYGCHALEFARRGYDVVGVDLTPAYIEDARAEAARQQLSAQFVLADVREVAFAQEFDVVLNMADGAIGYLENERENLKLFDVAARALRPGGLHFMDIMSADYADAHYPCKLWDAGKTGLTLSVFEWDRAENILLYGQNDFAFGAPLTAPDFTYGNPTRLYHRAEIERIMAARGMEVVRCFGSYDGAAYDENALQLMVLSKKG